MEQPSEIDALLKYYVYVYIDPRGDKKPFYIGKGTGNRYLSHLFDEAESEKVERIAEIRRAGLEPEIAILRHGLTDSEAHLVEAAVIDLIGLENLTNQVAGYHKGTYGLIAPKDVDMLRNPKIGTVDDKALLITINQLYRSNMSATALYEATRGIWKVGPNREKAEYAMAVYLGFVREVYRIEKWHPAGTLKYQTRQSWEVSGPGSEGRWEFSGAIAEKEIQEKYYGMFVGKGGQNPIRYVNI